MDTTWRVLPHSPLQQLAENLWWADGAVPKMSLRRSCTLVRLPSGGLLVHNAICFDETTQANVEALGPIEYVVIPNAFHRLDGPRYASRYPGAKIIAPRGGRKKISEVVRVDLTADEFPSDADVALLPLEGVRGRENVLKVRSDDGVTLVFNDAVFNVPHQKGFSGLVLRLMGSSGGPRTTPLARFTLYDDKSAARHGLEAFADTPNLVRIVPGHGDVVTENAPAVLRQVATTL